MKKDSDFSPLKIAIMSDPHLSMTNDLHYKQWQYALNHAQKADHDIYLVAGDLSEAGSKEEFELFQESIESINKPILYVPGNHDLGNKKLTGNEGEIDSTKIKNYRKNLGADFHAQNFFGIDFIGLNSQLFSSGLQEEKDQLLFFESQLVSDAPKIIFMHAPLFVTDPKEAGGVYWNAEIEARIRLLQLLKDRPVLAVISGHLHRLVVNYTDILFISAPALSFGLPDFTLGLGYLTLNISPSNIHFNLQQIPRINK